ncbi:cupin-like domain-containing protein [Dokdonia sp.]|uniref:cupin-like domain-containing protein n=1 Tax=Dokdonia sp. TaxID=2024995 RepID=UPI0032656092
MIETAKKMFKPIKRISEISLSDFNNQYAIPKIPLVIEKMSQDWPATTKWSLSAFKARFADKIIEITRSSDAYTKEMRFEDFIEYMQETDDEHAYYFKNWEFEDDHPELLEEYKVLPHFQSWLDSLPAEQRPRFKWIYIGPKNSYSKLHIDILKTNAWNILFTGKKLWLFFPPEEQENLYSNQFHPDFPGYLFPSASGLNGYYAVQNPGEIMFTPGDWFHQVYNLESTIALTENYVNETNFDLVRDHLKSIENEQLLLGLEMLKQNFTS